MPATRLSPRDYVHGAAILGTVAVITSAFIIRRFHRSDEPPPPPSKTILLRVDSIPATSLDSLDSSLGDVFRSSKTLEDGISKFKRRALAPSDRAHFCATIEMTTSLADAQLVKMLNQAAQVNVSFTFSVDFDGITPVHECEAGAQVDIVTVSALGSHPVGSFKVSDASTVWLLDYLPHDVQNIRVLLYGYGTKLRGSDSKQSIADLGATLLERLTAYQSNDGTTQRPVIFISHSLGGLVVKEALVLASQQQQSPHSDLAKACYGMLFFGVPHLGLRHQSLMAVVEGQPNEELVNTLMTNKNEEPSPYLDKLALIFASICAGQYRIISFFEGKLSPTVHVQNDGVWKRTGVKTLMVTERSATSIRGAVEEVNIPLDRDHSGLVKFESRTDGDYTVVRERLKGLVREAPEQVAHRFERNMPFDPPSKPESLRSLAFQGMYSRGDTIEPPIEGTCQWLLRNKAFKKWASNGNGMFWIKGKPGSGKSTLLRYVLSEMTAIFPSKSASFPFFFHARGQELQKSELGFFRSLIHQMAQQFPDAFLALFSEFDERAKSTGEIGLAWNWTSQQLRAYLESSLPIILKQSPVVFLIDALDEGGEETAIGLIRYFKQMLAHLRGSLGSDVPIKILFTCRPYPIPSFDSDETMDLAQYNNAEIEKYVLSWFSDGRGPSTINHIAFRIIDKAQGVFLWARPVVERIYKLHTDGCSNRTIYAEIEKVPHELHDLYRSTVSSLENPAAFHQLVYLLSSSYDKVPLTTVQWALAIPTDCAHKSLKQCEESELFISYDKIPDRVKALSGGLIEVKFAEFSPGSHQPCPDADSIQFIHQSVLDFVAGNVLAGDDRTSLMSVGEAGTLQQISHSCMSRLCIRYLKMEEIDDLMCVIRCPEIENPEKFYAGSFMPKPWERAVSLTEKWWESFGQNKRRQNSHFAFIFYALYNWPAHMRDGQLAESALRELVEVIGWPNDPFYARLAPLGAVLHNLWHMRYFYKNRLSGKSMEYLYRRWDLLHIAAAYNIENLLLYILQDKKVVHTAAGRVSDDISRGSSAAERCSEKSTYINSVDVFGSPPLHAAVTFGHDDTISLLCKNGADVNQINHRHENALFPAVRRGSIETIQFLLENEADLECVDIKGDTPLLASLKRSLPTTDGVEHANIPKSAIVQLLLDKGADINFQNARGRTALSCACTIGARLQLENRSGEKYMLREDGGRCLRLFYDDDPVEISLSEWSLRHRGYDTYDSYDNPFYESKAKIVPLLIDRKPNIQHKDKDGSTPLLLACWANDWKAAKILLDSGADATIKSEDGKTPLIASMIRPNIREHPYQVGFFEIALLLLKGGTEPDATTSEGDTALMLAADHGRCDLVDVLIQKHVNIHAQNDAGSSALAIAARSNVSPACFMLLDAGAVIECEDSESRTPLHLAIMSFATNAVFALIHRGANIEARWRSYSPLALAVSDMNSHNGVHLEAAEELIKRGADIEAKYSDGRSPLAIAAFNGFSHPAQLFLQHRADTGSTDQNGDVPITHAARGGGRNSHRSSYNYIIQTLIEYGADINLQGRNGETALCIAAKEGNQSITETLVGNGADIYIEDDNGRTPLSWAKENGHDDISKLLSTREKELAGISASGGDSQKHNRMNLLYDATFSNISLEDVELYAYEPDR